MFGFTMGGGNLSSELGAGSAGGGGGTRLLMIGGEIMSLLISDLHRLFFAS
ncbi:hypothetical protein ACTHQF_02040 [Pedobacter sp. SAFR-022]|uniref:hypothetical protein n=1 Tax=Pedobacter sp. SAFR-022 TaxID=3436861 RepID=UPI003F808096